MMIIHTQKMDTCTHTPTYTHVATWAGCGERWSLSSCSDRCRQAPPAPSAASSSGRWSESSPPPPPPAASSAASGGPSIYPARGGGRDGERGGGGKGQSTLQRSGWDIHGRRKEGNKKRREGEGYIKIEIRLWAGGLEGIRSQIKPGRLSQMMFWEESQCLCCGFGIYFSEWNGLCLLNEHTDAIVGLGLGWIEPDKSLILGWFFNTVFVPWGTIKAASLADPIPWNDYSLLRPWPYYSVYLLMAHLRS